MIDPKTLKSGDKLTFEINNVSRVDDDGDIFIVLKGGTINTAITAGELAEAELTKAPHVFHVDDPVRCLSDGPSIKNRKVLGVNGDVLWLTSHVEGKGILIEKAKVRPVEQ